MKSEPFAELRGQIDTVDDQIIALLLKRVHLSNTVIKLKDPKQIVDAQREQEIRRRYSNGLASVSSPAKAERVVYALLRTSRFYPDEPA